MIPNNQHNPLARINDLVSTIKRVYASTFYQKAKDYVKMTSHRSEEEKMAVIIQKMVGLTRGKRFYPDFSGVAKSYNFYPLQPATSSDGIVAAALGLGKTVVEGGNTIRFCPKYPTDLIQFYSIDETLNNSQREFYALQLEGNFDFRYETHDMLVKQYGLDIAEKDGPLTYVGSTYSPENETISDGLARSGPRVVTFGPILRGNLFPLPEILELLLDMGMWGMGTPVELEFAGNIGVEKGKPMQFCVLQIRPLVVSREPEALKMENYSSDMMICRSNKVLGNGTIEDINDIILVDYHVFERSKSRVVAKEVSVFNSKLLAEKRPYLLIGVGRWGSLDPWLGIPVRWENISGAKVIVESGFKEISVTPSQGSHFFHNITSFLIGYFTINNEKGEFIDWDWLLTQEALEIKNYTRHIRFDSPIIIKMNGHKNMGVILKPNS
jgi:hypothetical protein